MKQEVTIEKIDRGIVTAGCDKKACEGCKSSMFCNRSENLFEILNEENIELAVGDKVEVDMKPSRTIAATLMSLAVPLLGFFIGMVVAYLISLGEMLQLLCGIIGLAIGFTISFLYFRFTKKKYMPIIRRKIEK